MKIAYESWRPGPDARAILRDADAICIDYQAQGYDLTLRQLYYQFVSRGLIPNNQKSYDRLGQFVNKGRLAGYLDWDHIVDRTRNLQRLSHWSTPASAIRSAAHWYANNLWADQPHIVEVWVEKEALAGVVERAAEAWDCAWFSCRGYVSQSEMWSAAQRIGGYFDEGKRVTILHLGDHDPSGIDMTRDIEDRLLTFTQTDWATSHGWDIDLEENPFWRDDVDQTMRDELSGDPLTIHRIALNRDQVDLYQPPPNPAKITDSRAAGYIAAHGRSSWELDALEPSVLDALIRDHIADIVDHDLYAEAKDRQEAGRRGLVNVSDRWAEVVNTFVDEE